MRSLLRFIFRYHFFFLFLLLESVCFMLIAGNNFFQRASIVNTSSAFTGTVLTAFNNVEEYFSLRRTNRLLAEENALLRNHQIESYLLSDTMKYLKYDELHMVRYEYVPAKVVNNTVNRQKNYITINRGSKYGIAPDMAVISSNGIVGIVIDVTENFSTAISILHIDTKISAKIRKNGYIGSLTWDGTSKNMGLLSDISTYVTISKGDTVVTSGFSTVFPENIMVGQIEDFYIPEGENFFKIKVRFSTDFSNLSFAYVIKNHLQKEQKELEERSVAKNE
ncbi:MAG: rod shape-determining protein MreC [Bacteroidetes bacterium]|nr:rod shape-determining protein MreC [Bacteroidota bacterium]MBU1718643.1 rod shape-determining protein MreC [Bacteroidota bacterium]